MHPILFELGPLTIYSYGLMVALGFITATFLASRLASQFNISQEKITMLSLVILISGILGARIFYVSLNIKDFLLDPIEIFMVNHGGLVFYGGAIFAFAAALAYIKRAKLTILDTADLVSPFIALGHSIGRIGCLLNGCCFGKPTSSPFGIILKDGISRYPTQIYSSLYLLMLYGFLRICLRYRQFKGQVFFSYLVFYSTGRFFIEFLRGDNAPVILNLTFSQVVSLIIFGCGIFGYCIKRDGRR